MKPTGLLLATLTLSLLGAGCPDSGAVLTGGGVSDIGGDGVSGPVVSDALIVKMLGGDEPDAGPDGAVTTEDASSLDASPGDGGDGVVADVSAVDGGGSDSAVTDAGGAGAVDAVGLDTGSVIDAGDPDAGAPDTGTPDTGTPDTGTPDTGGGASTAACFALLGATCDKLDQCAGEVPFGGQQFAQYAAQCTDIVADSGGQLDAGCEGAAGSLSGVTAEEAASCVSSLDCGLSGLGTLAQALYPVFQAYDQGKDIGGTIPDAVSALLGACK